MVIQKLLLGFSSTSFLTLLFIRAITQTFSILCIDELQIFVSNEIAFENCHAVDEANNMIYFQNCNGSRSSPLPNIVFVEEIVKHCEVLSRLEILILSEELKIDEKILEQLKIVRKENKTDEGPIVIFSDKKFINCDVIIRSQDVPSRITVETSGFIMHGFKSLTLEKLKFFSPWFETRNSGSFLSSKETTSTVEESIFIQGCEITVDAAPPDEEPLVFIASPSIVEVKIYNSLFFFYNNALLHIESSKPPKILIEASELYFSDSEQLKTKTLQRLAIAREASFIQITETKIYFKINTQVGVFFISAMSESTIILNNNQIKISVLVGQSLESNPESLISISSRSTVIMNNINVILESLFPTKELYGDLFRTFLFFKAFTNNMIQAENTTLECNKASIDIKLLSLENENIVMLKNIFIKELYHSLNLMSVGNLNTVFFDSLTISNAMALISIITCTASNEIIIHRVHIEKVFFVNPISPSLQNFPSVFSIGRENTLALINSRFIDTLVLEFLNSEEENSIIFLSVLCSNISFHKDERFISTGKKSKLLLKLSTFLFDNKAIGPGVENIDGSYFNFNDSLVICSIESSFVSIKQSYRQILSIANSEKFILRLINTTLATENSEKMDCVMKFVNSSEGVASFGGNILKAFANRIIFVQSSRLNVHFFEKNILNEGADAFLKMTTSDLVHIAILDQVSPPSLFKIFEISLSSNLKISLKNILQTLHTTPHFNLTPILIHFPWGPKTLLEGFSNNKCSFSVQESTIVTTTLPLVKLIQSDFLKWLFENSVIATLDFPNLIGISSPLVDLMLSSFNEFSWKNVNLYSNLYVLMHAALQCQSCSFQLSNITIRETNLQGVVFQPTKILQINYFNMVSIVILDSSFFENLNSIEGKLVAVDSGNALNVRYFNCIFRSTKATALAGMANSNAISTGIELELQDCVFLNCSSNVLVASLNKFDLFSVILKRLLLSFSLSPYLIGLGSRMTSLQKTIHIEGASLDGLFSIFSLESFNFESLDLKIKNVTFSSVNGEVIAGVYYVQIATIQNSNILIENCFLKINIYVWKDTHILNNKGVNNKIVYKNTIILDFSPIKIEYIKLETVFYFDGMDSNITIDNVAFLSELYSISNFINACKIIGVLNIANITGTWFKFRKELIYVFFPSLFFFNANTSPNELPVFFEKMASSILNLRIIRSKIIVSKNMADSNFLLVATKANITFERCFILVDRIYNRSFVLYNLKFNESSRIYLFVHYCSFQSVPLRNDDFKTTNLTTDEGRMFFLNFQSGLAEIEFRESVINLGYFGFNYFIGVVDAKQILFKGVTFAGVFITPKNDLKNDHSGSLIKFFNSKELDFPTRVDIQSSCFISVYAMSGSFISFSQSYIRKGLKPSSKVTLQASYLFDIRAKQISPFLFIEPGTDQNELEIVIKNSYLKKIKHGEGGLLGGARPKVTSNSNFYRDSYQFPEISVSVPRKDKIASVVTRKLKISSRQINEIDGIFNLTSSSVSILNFVKNEIPDNVQCQFYIFAFDDDKNLVIPEEFDRFVNFSSYISDIFKVNFRNTEGVLCAKAIDIVTYIPEINMSFSITKAFLHRIFKFLSDEQEDLEISLNLQICKNGEKTDFENHECVPCPSGTYSNNTLIDNLNSECQYCDSTKDYYCYGANIISPKSGFWRYTVFTENFLACPREESCLGDFLYSDFNLMKEYNNFYYGSMEKAIKNYNNEKIFMGVCEKGYKGIMCTECEEGLGRFSGFICFNCEADWKLLLQQILVIFLKMIFIFIQIKKALDLNYNLAKKKSLSLGGLERNDNLNAIISITRDHFQVIFLINKLAKVFSSNFQIVSFSFFTVFSPDVKDSFTSPCFFKKILGLDLHINYISLFFIIILHAFFIILFAFRKTPIDKRASIFFLMNYLWKLKNMAILILFIQFVGLLETFINQFLCIDIDIDGLNKENRMLTFLEISCHDGYRNLILRYLSIPGLLIVGLLIPLMIFGTLKIYSLFGQLEHQNILLVYGYFYYKYKKEFFFFDVIFLIFRTTYILIGFLISYSLIFEKSYQLNSLFLLMIICVFKYLLITLLKPYNYADVKTHSLLEAASFKILISSIFLGIILLTQQESNGVVSLISAAAFYLLNILLGALFLISYLRGCKRKFLFFKKIIVKILRGIKNLFKTVETLVVSALTPALRKSPTLNTKFVPKESSKAIIKRLSEEVKEKSETIKILKKEVDYQKAYNDLLKLRVQSLEGSVITSNKQQNGNFQENFKGFRNLPAHLNHALEGDKHDMEVSDDDLFIDIELADIPLASSKKSNKNKDEIQGTELISEHYTQPQKIIRISKLLTGDGYYSAFLSFTYAVPKQLWNIWDFSSTIFSHRDWCLSSSFDAEDGILTLNFMKLSKWLREPYKTTHLAAFSSFSRSEERVYMLIDISLADFFSFKITELKEPLSDFNNFSQIQTRLSPSAYEKLNLKKSQIFSGVISIECPLTNEEKLEKISYRISSRESVEILGICKASPMNDIVTKALLEFIERL